MPGGRLAISSFQGSLRRREDVDGTLGSASLETDYFLHDSEQMIARYAKVGTGAVALKNRYLWGPQIDQLLTDEQISSGTSGTVYSVLGDHLQTVRELVTFNSASQTTSIVDHRQFDSFGNVVSDSNSSVDTFFKYTGKYFDGDTKLQWNLNRWYDPFLGQWVSEDPIGFAGGDENLRRYVSNSPLNRVDSNGLMDLWFYWYFYGLGGELNLNSPGYTTLLQRLTSSPVTASGISALKAKIARQVVSRVYSEAVAPDSSGSFTFDAKHNVDYTPGIWNTVIGGFQEVLGDHVVVGEPTDEYLERTTLYSLGGSKLIATVRVKWWSGSVEETCELLEDWQGGGFRVVGNHFTTNYSFSYGIRLDDAFTEPGDLVDRDFPIGGELRGGQAYKITALLEQVNMNGQLMMDYNTGPASTVSGHHCNHDLFP